MTNQDAEPGHRVDAAAVAEDISSLDFEESTRFVSAAGAELRRFMMVYKFGLDEMMTKINILKEELDFTTDGCPIEHVSSRLKSLESVTDKLRRLERAVTLENVRADVHDIAGVRIVCSFISDVYLVAEMITRQADVTLVLRKDYIANPKPNGYKSLHLIVDTPVHLSNRVDTARVEIQLRTVAMDFWASLEHKIYYKYDQDVPPTLTQELTAAAEIAHRLDEKMQLLHQESRSRHQQPSTPQPEPPGSPTA